MPAVLISNMVESQVEEMMTMEKNREICYSDLQNLRAFELLYCDKVFENFQKIEMSAKNCRAQPTIGQHFSKQ